MVHFHTSGSFPSVVIFYTLFTFASFAFSGTYSGGSGTAENPYKISTVADWVELTETDIDLDKSFILTVDLNMQGVSVGPVAANFEYVNGNLHGTPFTGILEGNGHCIQNLVINQPDKEHVGLFAYLGSGGEIRNLSLINVIIVGGETVGGFVARNGFWMETDGGAISSCSINGTVTGKESCGGFVGDSYKGTIRNSVASAAIRSNNLAGGLVSIHDQSVITSCISMGSVTGMWSCGGLVGQNNKGPITACYATGEVNGYDRIGGFIGNNIRATITACYSIGKVTCQGNNGGGFIGSESEGTLVSCFWDIETSGQISSAEGKGLSSSQMKSARIFQAAGWGQYGWIMEDGHSRPHLPWENTSGSPIPAAEPIPLSGNGTEDDPYRVGTADEFVLLSWYAEACDRCFVLTADLDLAGQTLNPIGDLGIFTGTFDGQDHVLRNAVLERPGSNFVGIFASIGSEGQVRNLHVDNLHYSGRQYVGGLAGWNSGTITACSAQGSIVGKEIYIGGLVGGNIGGTIQTSYANITIPSGDPRRINDSCGGLVGRNDNGQILSCWATGSVTGRYSIAGIVGSNISGSVQDCTADCTLLGSFQIGGLVGVNQGSITNCSASGNVRGTNKYIGGLVGSNDTTGTISFCSATGMIEGMTRTGGLVGNNEGPITSCFATGSVSGDYYVGGLLGTNSSKITLCYARGAVTSLGSTGGLVGDQSYGSCVQSYSVGKVTGDDGFGGLIGKWGSTTKNSFWDIQTSGLTISAGGTGKTTQQMKSAKTYTADGWDLRIDDGDSADWYMPMDDYPKLIWQTEDVVAVPDLSQMTQAEAEAILRSNGLKIGEITTTTHSSIPPDKIAGQSPETGIMVEKGYKIAISISRGSPIWGDGTRYNPYQIRTTADFVTFAYPPYSEQYWACGVYIKLKSDLDLNGLDFNPIGNDSVRPFAGIFDGGGYVLRNITIGQPETDFVGLFGHVGITGQIRNLGVADCVIIGDKRVGGLAGRNEGVIEACFSTGIVKGTEDIGGLIGRNLGTIAYCHSGVMVEGDANLGGLVGQIDAGAIRECYATGSVSGMGTIGGLVGQMDGGAIVASYAAGAVAGLSSEIGGLVGRKEQGVIEDCYAAGAVVWGNGAHIGGLIGHNIGPVDRCVWDIERSGQTASEGGKGLSTSQMKSIALFQQFGWAGKGWVIDDGVDYPHLAWEGAAGTTIPQPGPIPLAGSGTEDDPYRIQTAEDLAVLSWYWAVLDKHIRLMNDLDLRGVQMDPIGDLGAFVGVFEGQNYILWNARIPHAGSKYVGIFGRVGEGGIIQDLAVENVYIEGGYCAGGLAGDNDGTIRNCSATGMVNGQENVGGLVGDHDKGEIRDSLAAVVVRGGFDIGGLVGQMDGGSVRGCYNTGSVTGTGTVVGGLIGNIDGGDINDCYAIGEVRGYSTVGGLAGNNGGGFIHSSYATVTVSGNGFVGGLAGSNGGTISTSYASGTINGIGSYIGGLVGFNGGGSIGCCSMAGLVSGIGDDIGGLVGFNGGVVTACYCTGQVQGIGQSIGGFAGYNPGTISTSYSTGIVLGIGDYIGGFVGISDNTVSNCYWDVETSGMTLSSGGTGKTTAEMKARATFTNADWDFVGENTNGTEDVWRMCADGIDYPRLSWEFALGGDMDCPDGVELEDMLYLAWRWMASTPETVGAADTNEDGKVDLLDLGIVSENWGRQ